MKKIIIAASLVLLTACSAPNQHQINFVPKATLSSTNIVESKQFSFSSEDARTAQYVALMDSGRERVEPIHPRQNVRIALENALVNQFESQGFTVTNNSDNTVKLAINEVLVSVKHSVLENEMNASVVLELTIENKQGKLVKTFNGTANHSGMFSASDEEIAEVLNNVTDLVLQKIAQDQEVQNYMKERF
jgi:uncharacterized lipoprotein